MKWRRIFMWAAAFFSLCAFGLLAWGYQRSLGMRELFAIDRTTRFFIVSDDGYLHIGREELFDVDTFIHGGGMTGPIRPRPAVFSERPRVFHWVLGRAVAPDSKFPTEFGISHSSFPEFPPRKWHEMTSLNFPYWLPIVLTSLVPFTVLLRDVGRREQRRVARHLSRRACLRCGYDLAMTPINSPCPECGLAAERSLAQHEHPDDCPPRWVWMIALATLLLVASYLVAISFFGAAMMLMDHNGEPPLALFALVAVALAAHAVANVLLSIDDRRRPFSWWNFLHRWSLRMVPLPPVAAAVMTVVFLVTATKAPGFPVWVNWIGPLALPLLMCPTLTFFRLRRLAIRLGRRRLAEHITIVAAGASASLIFLVLGNWLAEEHVRRADAFFYVFGVLPFVLVPLFNLWALLVLGVVTQRFFRSAREATARWRAADAARAFEAAPQRS
jgi:hypothetical protein